MYVYVLDGVWICLLYSTIYIIFFTTLKTFALFIYSNFKKKIKIKKKTQKKSSGPPP